MLVFRITGCRMILKKKNLYLSQLKNYKSYNRINISCFLQLHLMERCENINANEYIIYKER